MRKEDFAAFFLALALASTAYGAQPAFAQEDEEAPPPPPSVTGAQLCALGRYGEAIPYLQKASKLNPKDVAVIVNLGTCKMGLKDNEGAVKLFDDALKLEPKNSGAWAKRAVCKEALNDKKTAIADFTRAIDTSEHPGADLFFRRAQDLIAIEDFTKAIPDLTKTIEGNPRFEKAFMLRGDAYSRTRQHEKAIVDFNTYVRLTGGDGQSYLKRAGQYMQLCQFARAVHDYSEALRFDVNLPEALQNRSTAYTRLGKPLLAIHDANELIKEKGYRARGFSTRAYAQLSAGDIRGAKAIATHVEN